jgi:hypothetical protein
MSVKQLYCVEEILVEDVPELRMDFISCPPDSQK